MPFRDDLLNPIPGDNPAGVNLRYDPVADKIKEARREDAEMPQGAWKTALKVADYGQVIKVAGEAIAARGKDLQIAVWLVDAHVRREGFAALAPGFRFLHGLVEQFWDGLYPEVEDGDAEMRSAVLEWLGTKLPEPVRALPITANKLSWNQFKESRVVGYEADATSSEKQEQRNALIGEGKPTAEEFDQAVDDTGKKFYEDLQAYLEDALASLRALSELCDQKFGDVSPSFIKTRDALEEIAQTVRGFINKKGGPSETAAPQSAPVEEAPQAFEEPAPVSTGSAAAAPARAPRVSAGAEPTTVEDAAARLSVIARYLRRQDQYNIGPFLILRGLRFGEIRYNGPQIDATMLEAPSAELRRQLKQAVLDEDPDRILEATEAAMELPCGRAWLDVQRYTVRALESKGEYFKFVADAVRTELRGLLHDLPGLLDMTLTDDTPVANAETRAWIREEVLPPASAEAGPVAPPPEPEPAPPPEPEWRPAPTIEAAPPSMEQDTPSGESGDLFDTALRAAQEGRLDDAVALLSAELDRARSGRGRFKRRMQLAHLFLAAGHEKIAYPILEDLAAEIDRRGLEDWEAGDVLAHPLSLLLRCAGSMGGDEERLRALFARICRLDPQKALRCLE